MTLLRLVLLILLLASLTGCAIRENTYFAINDSEVYWQRSGFSIKPPSGSNWTKMPTDTTLPNSVVFTTGEGMYFGGATTNKWLYLKGTTVLAVSTLLDEPLRDRTDKTRLASALRNHLERYQQFSPVQIKEVSYDAKLGMDCVRYAGKAKKERYNVDQLDGREDEVKGYLCLHPANDIFCVKMESHNYASVNTTMANKDDQVDHFFSSLSFTPISSSVSRTFSTRSYQVGTSPSQLVYIKYKPWVALKDEDRVVQVNPEDGKLLSSVSVGKKPVALTVLKNEIWVANSGDGTVTRIDPTGAQAVKTIQVGGNPVAISGRDAAIWVADVTGNRVIRIDPADNRVVATVAVGLEPTSLSMGNDGVWVSNAGDGTVSFIDRKQARVVDIIKVGGRPVQINVADSGAWVADETGRMVIRIDRTTRTVQAKVPVGGRPCWLQANNGHDVFVAFSDLARIDRIDPATNQVFGPALPGEATARSLVIFSGSLWYVNGTGTSLTRVELNPYRQAFGSSTARPSGSGN